MKLPRDLNGELLSRRLARLDFEVIRQSGSHIVMSHIPTKETISVPAHRPLKVGTLRAILRDVEELTGMTLPQILAVIA